MTTREGLITSEFDDAGTLDELDDFELDAPLGSGRDGDDPLGEDDDWDDVEEEEDDALDADLELVVLGVAGTIVDDSGLVERAFGAAADAAGIAATPVDRASALDYVRETMGQEKIAVFRALTGDEDQAQHANAEFESAYAALAADRGVRPIAGVEDLVRLLRASGVKVALTTSSSRSTTDAVLDSLGWRDLADATLTSSEAGRGRPYPDLPLTALLRTRTTSVEGMVVVGDTASDIGSGIAAGAGLVVGVLTGAHDEETLLDAGADVVIESIADLPALLGFEDGHDDGNGDAVVAVDIAAASGR